MYSVKQYGTSCDNCVFHLSHQQVLGVGGFNSWRYNQSSLSFFDVGTIPAQQPCLILPLQESEECAVVWQLLA